MEMRFYDSELATHELVGFTSNNEQLSALPQALKDWDSQAPNKAKSRPNDVAGQLRDLEHDVLERLGPRPTACPDPKCKIRVVRGQFFCQHCRSVFIYSDRVVDTDAGPAEVGGAPATSSRPTALAAVLVEERQAVSISQSFFVGNKSQPPYTPGGKERSSGSVGCATSDGTPRLQMDCVRSPIADDLWTWKSPRSRSRLPWLPSPAR